MIIMQQNAVLNFLKKFTELGPKSCCIFGKGNRFLFKFFQAKDYNDNDQMINFDIFAKIISQNFISI